MTSAPGTYALIFRCRVRRCVRIGRLAMLCVRRGYYLYVGSAFGPGGVLGRVRRHASPCKSRHWHVDYLSAAAALSEIWYTHDATRREHDWAGLLCRQENFELPMHGFGASDCRCVSHLFFLPTRPAIEDFRGLLRASIASHAPVERVPVSAIVAGR